MAYALVITRNISAPEGVHCTSSKFRYLKFQQGQIRTVNSLGQQLTLEMVSIT